MTRIDFYVLPEGEAVRERFACRIVEKAWSQGHAVYVQSADRAEAAQLDALLWTYRAGSFLPHALVDEQTPVGEPPVLVGWEGALEGEGPTAALETRGAHPERAVLVSLAPEVPLFFSHFSRVVELVAGDATQRGAARERFRFYRDRGYELGTHEVSPQQLAVSD